MENLRLWLVTDLEKVTLKAKTFLPPRTCVHQSLDGSRNPGCLGQPPLTLVPPVSAILWLLLGGPEGRRPVEMDYR